MPFSLPQIDKEIPTRIVIDSPNEPTPVKNLRTMAKIQANYDGNKDGLDRLLLSGSCTPHALGWCEVIKAIEEASAGKHSKLVAINLRAETHGYVNQKAINLNAANNAINQGKKRTEIIEEEKKWLASLMREQTLKDIITHHEYKKNPFLEGVDIPIEKVDSMEDVLKQLNFEYHRLTVTDHRKPPASEVDYFVEILTTLESSAWVHVFCREGVGRTTTFMVMIDMLRNADKLSCAEILARQASVEPFCHLGQTHRKHEEYTPLFEKRFEFIQLFYCFARGRLMSEHQLNWSEYKKILSKDEDVSYSKNLSKP